MKSIFDFETPQEAALKERVARLEAQLQFYKELYGDWAEDSFLDMDLKPGEQLPDRVTIPLYASARISHEPRAHHYSVFMESCPHTDVTSGLQIGYYIDSAELDQACVDRDSRLFARLHDRLMRRLVRTLEVRGKRLW